MQVAAAPVRHAELCPGRLYQRRLRAIAVVTRQRAGGRPEPAGTFDILRRELGAPRPMKMGTMFRRGRYDAATCHALQSENLRRRAISRYARCLRPSRRSCRVRHRYWVSRRKPPAVRRHVGISRVDPCPSPRNALHWRNALRMEKSMTTPAERMKMMRERRRARGLRELRLVVADPRSRAVRRRIAKQVAGLDPDRERDALKWIESVSEFDADAAR